MYSRSLFHASIAIIAVCTAQPLAACDGPLEADPAIPTDPTNPAIPADPTIPTSPANPPSPADPATPVQPDPATWTGPLFTSFAPERAVESQYLRVPLAFDPLAAGMGPWDFKVTFPTRLDVKLQAQLTIVAGGLDVEVPIGAVDGEVCITWRGHSTCAGHLTILPGPIITAIEATPVKGGYQLALHGEAFLSDALIYATSFVNHLDTEHHDDTLLTAFLPDHHLTAGHASVFVHVPSLGRCGRASELFELVFAR